MDLDRDALVAAFVVESAELLAAMESAVMTLETGAADDETRQLLLRSAHTLKGNASCVAFDALEGYVHRFEEVLHSLASRGVPGGEAVSATLRVIDLLRVAAAGDGALPDEAEAALANAGRIVDESAIGIASAEMVSPSPEGMGQDRSIRVATEKLDRMIDLSGELAIVRSRVAKLVDERREAVGSDLAEAIAEAGRLDHQLQELVTGLRMVPVGPELQRFGRLVRDVAIAHGKLAQLRVDGGDVEIDTAVVAALRDPFTHMIRNAISHGIEPPDVRESAGKPRVGTIVIRARHSAGRIVVEIEDDGAGLDRERIRARAAELGLPGAGDGERALDDLIFVHGFSTASVAGSLSGRGIGMDVVRRMVERLRGSVEVQSSAGRGTRFTIRLPLTLAILDGFALAAGGETFIVPLDSVVECLDLPAGLDPAREEGLLSVRGEALPFVRLRHHLRLPGPPPEREGVLVVAHEEGRIGLAADRLLGETQTVIKPLGALLDRVPGLSAAAILGSGDVALILDVPQLVRQAIERHVSRSVA